MTVCFETSCDFQELRKGISGTDIMKVSEIMILCCVAKLMYRAFKRRNSQR